MLSSNGFIIQKFDSELLWLPPQFSYFNSCSNGGRMGLMEAQRYPTDFDGIISGHPATDITGTVLKFVQNAQAQYPDGNFANPTVPLSKLNLLTSTVLNKCDALDGINDGLINDPTNVIFDLKMICPYVRMMLMGRLVLLPNKLML